MEIVVIDVESLLGVNSPAPTKRRMEDLSCSWWFFCFDHDHYYFGISLAFLEHSANGNEIQHSCTSIFQENAVGSQVIADCKGNYTVEACIELHPPQAGLRFRAKTGRRVGCQEANYPHGFHVPFVAYARLQAW